MAKLINGNGNKAIWANQDADLIAALAGNVTGIAKVGNKFVATQEDANTIGLSDGVIVTKEGRRIQLDVGSVDLFDIPTGTAGVTSYYIIGYHLITNSDSSQTCETFVQKMDNATDVITENTFRGGATEVYVSCYRVVQDGLNIESINALLPELENISTLMSALGIKVEKWSGTVSGVTYVTVDKLAYDSTNKKLGLKVDGADTVIPFSSETVHTGTYKTYGVGTKDMGASHSYRYVNVQPYTVFFSYGNYYVPIIGAEIIRGLYSQEATRMILSTENVPGGILTGKFTTPDADPWMSGVAVLSQPIDVTQFSKLGLTFNVSNVNTYTNIRVGLTSDITTKTNPSSIVAYADIHPTVNTNITLECDITNISGSYYPFISYDGNQSGLRSYTMGIIGFYVA